MSLSNQTLTIAGRVFHSRLILGTGKFSSPEAMRDALEASGVEIVTVALRRGDDFDSARLEGIAHRLR